MSCAAVLLVRLAPPLPVLHPSKGGAIEVVPHPSTRRRTLLFLFYKYAVGLGYQVVTSSRTASVSSNTPLPLAPTEQSARALRTHARRLLRGVAPGGRRGALEGARFRCCAHVCMIADAVCMKQIGPCDTPHA